MRRFRQINQFIIKLQALARGYLTRQHVKAREQAAVRIQTAFREMLARRTPRTVEERVSITVKWRLYDEALPINAMFSNQNFGRNLLSVTSFWAFCSETVRA